MGLYVKTVWANYITPLAQDNLNHLEDGVETLSLESIKSVIGAYANDKINFSFYNAGSTYLDGLEISIPTSHLIKGISFNSSTNKLSLTKNNNTTVDIMNVYDTSKVFTRQEITGLLSHYDTSEQVNSKLENYHTKEQIDIILNGYYNKDIIDEKFGLYLTALEIQSLLSNYHTKAQITTLLNDYYTKTQIEMFLNNYYNKTNINECFTEIEVQED